MPTDPLQIQPDWLSAQSPREGRYVIGPLLGQGGMGDVHEAWDVVLCRTVALKVLKAIEPAALIRFMHEAQIHARVVHPNICRVYDVDNYQGSLRVAMQLVRGPNLEQCRGELSLREVTVIMALVAQAVHVVHRLNLVHRDLKPSNILLERDPEGGWTPFVCDFGLAMALDEPAMTYTRGVNGTPAYMAPEQRHGDRDRISAATDVYALGGTLHFALAGSPPGLDAPADQTVPRGMRCIIGKCLEADPDLRYPSAAALAEDLWRFQQGAPVLAARRRVPPFLRPRSLKRFKAALLVLAGAAVAAPLTYYRQSRVREAEAGQMALVHRIVVEALTQSRESRLELTQPVHDLRPRYARIRAWLEAERQKVRGLAPRWSGQGHFALGTAHGLARDWNAAKAELEMAWADGFRDPEVAGQLAWATLEVARSAAEAAEFAGGVPAPAAGPGHAAGILREPLAQTPDGAPGAVLAFLARDYQRGAATSHASFEATPFRWESAALESACLMALGRQELESGNLPGAKARCREALAAARAGLVIGESDPAMYHAVLQAGRQVEALDLDGGELAPALLQDLMVLCDKALRLDPGDPGLQDDWLGLRWLQARRLVLLGQDPALVLEAARVYLATWGKDPLTVRLRAARMLLWWQMAQQDLQRGRDPDPALIEALKTAGHTPFLDRDYFWELLNSKARADAARGVDPRPTLEAAMERMAPDLHGSPWTLKETLADSWLIRAGWEAGHGLDPAASLRNARALAESARAQNPDSGEAYALEGLGFLQELRASPRDRARLLVLARERLRLAMSRTSHGPCLARLRRAIEEQT